MRKVIHKNNNYYSYCSLLSVHLVTEVGLKKYLKEVNDLASFAKMKNYLTFDISFLRFLNVYLSVQIWFS